ncbi:hypothetical protein CsSME_00023497 [Camellia sinensis var. sinensis]
MATPFLLQSNIKLNPYPLFHPYPIPIRSPIKPIKKSPNFTKNYFKFNRTTSKLSVKCFFMSNNSMKKSVELVNEERASNPFEVIAKSILEALKALQKPTIAAVLVGLLLMYDPNSALAASGGRMGGKSFSSRSSSSSSSSRSASPGFSYSVPYYAPSPFGGGGYYVGPAVGVGVGAGSSFFLILMGFAAFMLVSGFLSDRSEGGVLTATEKTSVLKLQVGLLGMGRSLQRDLNRIAETADTSTSEGLSYVLTGGCKA